MTLFRCLAAALLLASCGSAPRRTQAPLVAGTPRADAANAVLFRAMSLVGTLMPAIYASRIDPMSLIQRGGA